MHKEPPSGIMASIPEGMFTRSQVADLIGRSKDTIRRWHDTGLYESTHPKKFGEMTVWLYTEEDVENLRKVARETRPGRPRKDG